MSLPKPKADADLYEADFFAWTEQQAALLRARRPSDLDWENLAEEIESLGKSEKREIDHRLQALLTHLLKWRYQPEQRKGGWETTSKLQRLEIARTVRKNPSLRRYPAEEIAEEYIAARILAADETGLPESAFPETCPFTADEVLDPAFWPGVA